MPRVDAMSALDEWELQWPFPLEPEPPLTCFCGAPAVGWVYDVMGDGQTINGLAVCQKHQEEIG